MSVLLYRGARGGSVGGGGSPPPTGDYGYLAPTVATLPMGYNGVRMQYDGATGKFTGTTVNTTEPTWATTETFVDTGNAATNRTNLENAINAKYASSSGNHCILIPAGTQFAGRIVLNTNASGHWVGVKTASHASLPAASDGTSCGTKVNRVAPSHTTHMPKFWPTTTNQPSFLVGDGCGKLYLRGLHFANDVGFSDDTFTSLFADYGSSDVIIAQCVALLGCTGDPAKRSRRPFMFRGSRHAVVDSYGDEIGYTGADSNFVLYQIGPGPFKFTNNYSKVGGDSENFMSGGGDLPGTDDSFQNSDIDCRGNVCDKPSWGNHKAHLEIKLGVRVLIADNWCGNHNGLGQQQSIIVKLSAQGGANPTSASEHITIMNNVMEHPTDEMPGGITITSRESWGGVNPDDWTKRMRNVSVIGNKLVTMKSGVARCLQIGFDCFDIECKYNTAVGGAFSVYFPNESATIKTVRLNIQYNVMVENSLVGGSGSGPGQIAMGNFTTDSTLVDNLIGANVFNTNYAGNILCGDGANDAGFVNPGADNYALSASSLGYQAAPGSKDYGANIPLLNALMAEVL